MFIIVCYMAMSYVCLLFVTRLSYDLQFTLEIYIHWIGWSEKLQDTMFFSIKYSFFPADFPLNQSNDTWTIAVVMID